MKFFRTGFNGDSNIGLYGFATDNYCVIGMPVKHYEKIEKVLKLQIKTATIAGTELVGIFSSGNSSGIILPAIATENEIKKFKQLGLNVLTVKSKYTALGNLILCNDNGCLISPHLKKFKNEIADVLGCEVQTGKVAGLTIPGSASIASNKGCLCHMDAKENELKLIENLLKVKADIGSVGGSPFVNSGMIVNKNGFIVSEYVTGPELQRIYEVFGYE